MEQINVEIATDGKVTVSVKGVKGKSCTDVTKSLENALGQTTSDEKTREYNDANEQQVARTQGR
jgi:hypothetical protein